MASLTAVNSYVGMSRKPPVHSDVRDDSAWHPEFLHSARYSPPRSFPARSVHATHATPGASKSQAGGRDPGDDTDDRIRRQSCERCRSRRSRCVTDGVTGVCQACRDLGVECIYTGIDKRRQSTKQLRARLAYLEDVYFCIRNSPDEALRELQWGIRAGKVRNEASPIGSSTVPSRPQKPPSICMTPAFTVRSRSESLSGSASGKSFGNGKNVIPIHLNLSGQQWQEAGESVRNMSDRLDR